MTHSSMHRCIKYLCWHIVQAAIIGLREQHSHNGCCRIDLRFWQQNRFCIICKQLSLCGSPDSQSCAYFQYQWFTVISQGSFFSSSCYPKAHRSAISKQVNPWDSEINMLVRFADQNSFHMFSKTVLINYNWYYVVHISGWDSSRCVLHSTSINTFQSSLGHVSQLDHSVKNTAFL